MSRRLSEIEILDRFSPAKFGKIVPTSVKKREDVISCFRPNKGECLDYDISQTILRMDAGDTKINIRDTHATYVPAPPVIPKKKKRKDESPPKKFINEIWLENQNALQEKYKKELRRNLRMDKIRAKYGGRDVHNLILSMVGPEWFQELSPNQLRTVDQLHCCILMDIKNKSITNVQDNIGRLGLVLRPNHRHIAKALKLCCKSPVEFLLILYQIMNPNRKEYSLNDRLLLSAVVHLCMTETLRELHIRIPSPPVVKNVTPTKPKLKKKIKYASPYLEPFIITPILHKHSGIYENPRIQRPESPYFSYLETLVIDRGISEDIFEMDLTTLDPDEAELIEDMRRAQLMYDELQGKRVNLLKPSIWKQCKDAANFYKSLYKEKPRSLVLPPLSTLDDSEEECYCSEVVDEISDISSKHESISCECQDVCDCKRKSKIFISSKCKACLARDRKKYVQRVIKGITITEENTVIPIIEGTVLQKTCDCLHKYQDNIIAIKARNNLRCQKAKFVIVGVAMTKEGPVYVLSTALKKRKNKIIINPNFSEHMEHNEEVNSKRHSQSLRYSDDKELGKDKKIEKQKGSACLEYTCSSSKYNERSTNTKSTEKNAFECEKYEDGNNEEMPCGCEDCKCKERSKMYTGSRCNKCQEKERQKYIERIITGMKETCSHKIVPIIEGTRLLNSCDCLQKYAERILSMEARNKIQNQNAQFVVGGVVFTKDGPVYILSTALLSKKDTCQQICIAKRKRSHSKEKKPVPVEEEPEEDLKYSGCKCKQELERFLKHKCTCEECNVRERHAEGITFIMGGTTSQAEDDTINIVQGVYEPRCDCLQKYKEKIDKLENYRRRIEAKYNLKSQTLKYSIGGVVNTPNGPVYVITGMRPPVDCECAMAARKKEEEELHLQQMAKMPPTGRIKYQIAGVRESPEGNVFLISQALAIDDCECVKLYDTYIQAHRACLDIYESFLKQTNEALEEYMSETPNDDYQEENTVSEVTEYFPQNARSNAVNGVYSQNSYSHYNLFEKGQVVTGIERTCPGQKLNICTQEVVSSSEESLISQCTCLDVEEETSSESTLESRVCADTCMQDLKTNNTVVGEETELVQVEEKKDLKRFIILKKIPEKLKKQRLILKKALAKMAEDGFPLAKLPDCHKLPHFKLWMQLRCGKIWSQKDIDSYELRSKTYWSHVEICPINFKLPTIGMSYSKAAKMTWQHAHTIKKIVKENVEMFYRQVGQTVVENAREFFPISYSYEFPNKTFRNTFFAYMPSKEKDTLAFKIVKPHDVREISKKYSCYC